MNDEAHEADCGYTVTGHPHNCSCPAGENLEQGRDAVTPAQEPQRQTVPEPSAALPEERRFIQVHVSLTLWQSIKGLLAGNGWSRAKSVLSEVRPGHPLYESAPFAEGVVPASGPGEYLGSFYWRNIPIEPKNPCARHRGERGLPQGRIPMSDAILHTSEDGKITMTDAPDTFEVSREAIEYLLSKHNALIDERLRGLSSAWTQDLPTEAGAYWWWDGDEDCAPIHVEIEFSGFDGTYFAPQGQWGWTRFRPVSEMGGWWMKLGAPQVPAEALAGKEGA